MLSYQHAYHAGGPADVHKHMWLARVLTTLTRKARPLSYMETHSGRGLYNLDSDETLKTGEAAEGIHIADLSGEPFEDVLNRVRGKHGPSAYPGSPMVAHEMLRPQDRLSLMELHPAEVAALRHYMKFPTASIHHRDGYEGVMAISPPKPRKGLVLIDPSYEVKTEYAQAGDFTRKLIAKWPEACVLIWYPILRAGLHRELLSNLSPLKVKTDEVPFDLKGGTGMLGSGMAIINAPYGL